MDSYKEQYDHSFLNGKTDVLFVLPPLYVFMKRDIPSFRLGPGYLSAYLKHRGISSKIYNADICKPGRYNSLVLGRALKNFIRILSGFAYFSRHWPTYYKKVGDPFNPVWRDLRIVLRRLKPRVACISALMVTVPSAVVTAKIIREELPETKIVIGGPAATTCTDELIKNKEIDFLVLGEGEETLAELVAFLLGPKKDPSGLEAISGIMYRNGSGTIKTPSRALIQDLDSIPFPDREATFVLGNDGELKRVSFNADILASRGCPYPCKFCCAFTVWGTRKTRLRGVDNILAEIIQLNRVYGQRYFVFWDDLFTVNRERVVELCGKIISNGLDIEWVCLVRLNTIDAELLAIMKRAGCREIQIGIESGNDRILKYIGKDINVDLIRAKAGVIRSSGIDWGVFLIIGFPSETHSEMEDTLRLIKEIRPTWVSISVFTPYPGSDFFEELERKGHLGLNYNRGDFWYLENNYTGTMRDSEFKNFAARALNYGDRYNMRRLFKPGYIWKKIAQQKFN